MTTVYLIRHAQAEGNLYRRCQGWHDGMLTIQGHRQVEALSKRFLNVPVDAVYSSDLTRTMTTAAAIYQPHSLSLQIDQDLREIGGGCWEDHTWGEILHRDRNSLRSFLQCSPEWQVDGSETFPGVRERLTDTLSAIASAHPDQTVAVVSHGSAIRAALSFWLGMPVEDMGSLSLGDNTSVAKLEFHCDQVKVCYYNDNSHLGELANAIHPRKNHGSDMLIAMEQTSLRFRPLLIPEEEDFYLAARKDGWMASHGTMDCFNGAAFLDIARRNSEYAPESVLVALIGNKPVGVLQMDWREQADEAVGRIPFFYIAPEYRSKGLGVQLLGQAVSAYRNLGRQKLRLRCAPENERAKKFYLHHGFQKIGEEPGGIGHLDTMEKLISRDCPLLHV